MTWDAYADPSETNLSPTQEDLLRFFREHPSESFDIGQLTKALPERDEGNVIFALGILTGLGLVGWLSDNSRRWRVR